MTKIRAFINKLKKNDSDWWDELDESTKEEIQIGIDQADKGEFIEHDEAAKRLDKLFKEYEDEKSLKRGLKDLEDGNTHKDKDVRNSIKERILKTKME